jgi:hypothetical protein
MAILSKIAKERHFDVVEKFYFCKALSLDTKFRFCGGQYSCKYNELLTVPKIINIYFILLIFSLVDSSWFCFIIYNFLFYHSVLGLCSGNIIVNILVDQHFRVL